MRYIEFGANKTKVSEVVLGMMRIWEKTPEEVADLIECGLDCGINAVDTAPIYGPSEGKLGQAFAARLGLRDRVWLQTKLGIRPHPRARSGTRSTSPLAISCRNVDPLPTQRGVSPLSQCPIPMARPTQYALDDARLNL